MSAAKPEILVDEQYVLRNIALEWYDVVLEKGLDKDKAKAQFPEWFAKWKEEYKQEQSKHPGIGVLDRKDVIPAALAKVEEIVDAAIDANKKDDLEMDEVAGQIAELFTIKSKPKPAPALSPLAAAAMADPHATKMRELGEKFKRFEAALTAGNKDEAVKTLKEISDSYASLWQDFSSGREPRKFEKALEAVEGRVTMILATALKQGGDKATLIKDVLREAIETAEVVPTGTMLEQSRATLYKNIGDSKVRAIVAEIKDESSEVGRKLAHHNGYSR